MFDPYFEIDVMESKCIKFSFDQNSEAEISLDEKTGRREVLRRHAMQNRVEKAANMENREAWNDQLDPSYMSIAMSRKPNLDFFR